MQTRSSSKSGASGSRVAVPPQVARTAHLGAELHLHTTLIVREDALSLFGFETHDELSAFSLLLGVTGVGPKSALGVLATLSVDQIADAVAADDDAPFRRVSGIGPKTAKLIVVQLAGKLAPSRPVALRGTDAASAVPGQVTQALVGLGWSERVAAEAVAIRRGGRVRGGPGVRAGASAAHARRPGTCAQGARGWMT